MYWESYLTIAVAQSRLEDSIKPQTQHGNAQRNIGYCDLQLHQQVLTQSITKIVQMNELLISKCRDRDGI